MSDVGIALLFIATKRTIAISLAIKDNSAYFTRYRDWLEISTVVP
jgi:hypothetical protein